MTNAGDVTQWWDPWWELGAWVDCGFSQYWDQIRCHPSVQCAKLEALAKGAAVASKALWGRWREAPHPVS